MKSTEKVVYIAHPLGGESTENPSTTPHPNAARRVLFSVAEAARMLGRRPEALRRLIERHAQREGDEIVARLSAGVVARKRVGFAYWAVIIPKDLVA
jgi:hypothetical protein